MLGVVAVLTHASRISSSPVSYISESVVAQPRDDETLCRLESGIVKKRFICREHFSNLNLRVGCCTITQYEDTLCHSASRNWDISLIQKGIFF